MSAQEAYLKEAAEDTKMNRGFRRQKENMIQLSQMAVIA